MPKSFTGLLRNKWHTRSNPASMSIAALLSLEGMAPTNDCPVRSSSLHEAEDGAELEYNPDSPEPRYVQMAKHQLLLKKDLRCRDCGFTGLPSPDKLCPDCGGLMDAPEQQAASGRHTTAEIRDAIRRSFQKKLMPEGPLPNG